MSAVLFHNKILKQQLTGSIMMQQLNALNFLACVSQNNRMTFVKLIPPNHINRYQHINIKCQLQKICSAKSFSGSLMNDLAAILTCKHMVGIFTMLCTQL